MSGRGDCLHPTSPSLYSPVDPSCNLAPNPEQIYVEIERARLTKQLARMKEAEGNIAEAAEILQEVPVVSRGMSPDTLSI